MVASGTLRPRYLYLVCGWILAVVAAAQALVFTPHYTDSPGEGFFDPALGANRRTAFEFALSIWQVRIPGAMNANVDVSASFNPLGGTAFSATLGMGGPSEFDARFAGVPRTDVAYPSALANYLSATNLNGPKPDIDIEFNSDVDGSALGSRSWYYGLDARAPSRDLDFVTVALHELTHSLGFISSGFADGSFGVDTSRGTLPDSFDAYLVNGAGQRLVDLPALPTNVTRPVFWSGPQGLAQYQHAFAASDQPRLYSPPSFEDGSSLSHLDEDRFVGSYDLMTPFSSQAVHVPDDVVRGMMADIGWQLAGTGDTDLSGQVDLLDVFAIIRGQGPRFGDPGYKMALDINLDGIIDAGDLSALTMHFAEASLLGTAPSGGISLANHMLALPGRQEQLVYQQIPEPLSVGLLLVGLLASLARPGCRRTC